MLNVNMLNLCFGPFSHHKCTDSVCVCVCVCVCACTRACTLLEDRDAAGTQLMLFIPPGSLFLSNPESQACQRGGCLCWGKKL